MDYLTTNLVALMSASVQFVQSRNYSVHVCHLVPFEAAPLDAKQICCYPLQSCRRHRPHAKIEDDVPGPFL